MSSSDDDGAGMPLIEDLSDSVPPLNPSSTKRKRDDAPTTESTRAKKRKALKKSRAHVVDDAALDVELGVNHAIAHMDSQLLADHLAQRTKRFQPDLSPVEADDLYISAPAIRDTSAWQRDRSLASLPIFMDKYAAPRRKKKQGPSLADAFPETGTPHTLVIAASGLRAADLTRALRGFQTKEAFVTKLFAKHIKLKEAVETVRRARMNIGVGTPQRVVDLIENGAMSVKKLERIVIDASHIDQKKRGILDMREIHVPLMQLLSRKDFKERYGIEDDNRRVELIFF